MPPQSFFTCVAQRPDGDGDGEGNGDGDGPLPCSGFHWPEPSFAAPCDSMPQTFSPRTMRKNPFSPQ